MKKIWSALALLIIFVSSAVLVAQQPYKLPPKEVIDIVDAPPLPRALISPRKDLMLLAEYEPMPSIAYLAQPILRIAGIRITSNITSRLQTTFYTGLVFKSIKNGQEQRVELPPGIKFGSPQWSYNGRWVAFSRYLDAGIELWVVDALTGKARKMELPALSAVLTSGYSWLPDNRSLLVFTIPEGRGNPPTPPSVPVGPNIQETAGKFVKVQTYQDLLKTPFDETLFDYYATSQLLRVDVTTGQTQKLGAPGIYASADCSPDGNFILVYRIKKPYSYSVPYSDFTHSVDLWDGTGKFVRTIADLPAAEEVPLNGVPTGPREFEWQPLKSASLIWAEALDGGDPEKDVPNRDKIMNISAPFEGEPKEVVKIRHRYSGVTWLGQKGLAFVTEFDWKKKWETTYLFNTELPEIVPRKIFDLSAQDEYNAPGYAVLETTLRGERIAVQDKDRIYLSGPGSSPQGDRPFLDRLSTRTLEKTRLHQSGEMSYETFVAFLNPTRDSILTSLESKTEPPNYYLVNLKTKKRKPLTAFKDPAPQLTTLKKELIKYKREDGVELSGTLYLPPGYKEGERLPVLVWAYPLEYNDPGTAGQVRGSPNRFTFFRGTSELFFLTQGYAVLDNAQMPVVGDPKTMNDTFVEQIVMNAKAAINALDSRGVGDPKRVGVGGHSYGAFMTANLLAHCDLFAAGIARSGAYNRTLTPFGFQSERRTLWQAPEIYFKLSPFMCADKINEPILLIHGEADNNSGTFPIQSERLFQALKGFGATARLVMLPYESHGYAARESVLDVLAEMFEWFDKYVKNKK